MTDKHFLDTNIFVYSFDHAAPKKRARAQALIDDALTQRSGFISTQVVQELLNVALGKFATPMSLTSARLYLENVLLPLCSVFPSADLYTRALNIRGETQFSFYDSLIVAAAQSIDCRTLFSEDMQDGRKLGRLTIRNPFS
jgi:predicted nucleic acid-binding protein